MTPEQRKILVGALERLAEHRPIEHRAYGSTVREIRQRMRDTAWASGTERDFCQERAFVAGGAREALDGQQDDALVIATLDAIAGTPTHEDWEAGWPLKARHGWVDGSRIAASHCANIARRALRACGLPARPDTADLELIARFVSTTEERIAAAHRRLAEEAPVPPAPTLGAHPETGVNAPTDATMPHAHPGDLG